MATNATTTKAPAAPKTPKAPVKLGERIKSQLNAAALRGKLTVEECAEIEAHVRKVAALLGA